MKNDDNVEVWTDPEQEAKVVAMLNGELSAFEMAELEENLAQSPELRLFLDRMIEVQALISEVNEQENEDDDWKLSSERRGDLLEKISQPVRVEKVEVKFSRERNDTTKIQWRNIFSIAACLIVSLILTVVVFPFKRFTNPQLETAHKEPPIYSAQDERRAALLEIENQRNEVIAQYKQKIEAQEDKVEDNRARLYKLSKSLGIPYHGINSQVASTYNQGGRQNSAEAIYDSAKRERDQLEILVKDLSDLNDQRVRTRILATNRPEASILSGDESKLKNLTLQKDNLLASGMGDDHPRIESLEESLSATEAQLKESTKMTREKLKNDLVTMNKRLESLQKDSMASAGKSMNTAEDQTQFGKVKEEYEREFAILQSIKGAEFRETITAGLEDPLSGEFGREPDTRPSDGMMKRQYYRSSNDIVGRERKESENIDDLVWVEEKVTKPEISNQVKRKPSAPGSSMANIVAGKSFSGGVIATPEIAIPEPSLDFGDGDGFGTSSGGGGKGREFNSLTKGTRSGNFAISGQDIDGRIDGLSKSGNYAIPRQSVNGFLNLPNSENIFPPTDPLTGEPLSNLSNKNRVAFSIDKKTVKPSSYNYSQSSNLSDTSFVDYSRNRFKLEGLSLDFAGADVTQGGLKNDNSLITQEIASRLSFVTEADKSIVNGRDAYTKKNYEKAVDEYKKALNLLPQGPIAKDRRASYAGYLLDGQIALSSQYRRTGRLAEAKKLLNDALEADPGNALALKQLEYLDDPIRTSPTLTYEHVKNVEKVRKYLYRGESLYNQGQFDDATKEYKEILRLDPYNKAARWGLEKVDKAKSDYYRAAYDSTRAAMLMDVDSAWETAVPPTLNGKSVENESLTTRKKLQDTTLENLEFGEETTVKQAINFLRLRSRELDQDGVDPSKRGISFKFRDRAVGDPDIDGFTSDEETAGFGDLNKIEDIKLGKLDLRNVPMEEALKQIAQKTGLRYKVEGNDIVMLRATDIDDSEMYTRTFRVPDDFLQLLKDNGREMNDGDPFSDEKKSDKEPTLNELIQRTGIPMPDGASVIYSKERGAFTIRNTANNLDVVENLTTQLAVESKKLKAAEASKSAKPPKPQTLPNETSAADKADSTFSLNVSDVSFELARVAMLEKNTTPEAAKIRPEEFVNAFDYEDPSASGNKVTCAIEQCAHPVLQQRNLMRIGMKTGAIGRSKPLRLTILLDNSGSMEREDREATVLKAIEALASKLGPQDEVTLLSFARNSRLVAQKMKGDQAGKLVQMVKAIPSEGGTNLSRAITQAHYLAKKGVTKQTMSRIVLITDGAANLGNADPDELTNSIVSMRRDGIAFDACGVGADGLDDNMLETLTRKGDGRYYFINKAKDADTEFAEKIAGALRPAAKNVKVQVIFNPERVGNYRLLGFEKHLLKKEDFRNDKVDAAEMAAEEAGNALYQVEALPSGRGNIGRVFVRFMDMETGQMVERSWTIPYDPQARNIIDTQPSMQLASVAGLLGEKLKFGKSANIDLTRLNDTLGKLRVHFHGDKKVQDLIRMTQKASR